MNRNVVVKAYWRSIKRGVREMSALPGEIRPYVLLLAQAELEKGAITREEYDGWMGTEGNSQ